MANLYYNRIVRLNVSETVAPTPNRLQGTAAIVSMGGTTIPAGTTQLISSSADLANFLQPAFDIATISWSAGVVSLTTTNPHGIPSGDTTLIEIAGMTPTGYNGTFTATSGGANSLQYALAADPGVQTVLGSLQTGPQLYLQAADATWWGQGNALTGYYVYETASADPAVVIASVTTYLDNNPQTIYNWGFLPGIDADTVDATALFLLNNTLTSLIKFYLPVTVSSYGYWASQDTLRNTFIFIQSPGANPLTELDSISFMQYITAFTPTPTNKLPPSQYTYLNAVTAYAPLTQSIINTYLAGNVNFVATGAEGGISNTILVPGKNLNGTPANVGYSIDWVQINLNTDISNAVINGSNNPEAPLYYNQDGINFLQQVAATTANRAIQSGLALGQVIVTSLAPDVFASNVQRGDYAGNFVINAVPFNIYVALNPADYANQLYGGFQAAYTPQYGFETIVFNLNVTQFA